MANGCHRCKQTGFDSYSTQKIFQNTSSAAGSQLAFRKKQDLRYSTDQLGAFLGTCTFKIMSQ